MTRKELKTQVEQALRDGKTAFANGISAPCLDENFMKMTANVSHDEFMAIGKAWSRGNAIARLDSAAAILS